MTMFGLLLFLTYDYQAVHRYTALRAGVAFLPLVAGMLLGAAVIAGRLPHGPPRLVTGAGCLIAAAGMTLLTTLTPASPYWLILMPAELIVGTGLGISFTPAMNLATHAIDPADVGVASGLINASQQIGGAIGAAFLNAVAALATAAWLTSHARAPDAGQAATVHGYAVGARWAVGILLLAGLVAVTMIRAGAHRVRVPDIAAEQAWHTPAPRWPRTAAGGLPRDAAAGRIPDGAGMASSWWRSRPEPQGPACSGRGWAWMAVWRSLRSSCTI